ncbi:MAG: hypothetical protein U5L72_14770 [Bacteroidales bacterium]|nr:hypothetical protein [Bacteroidales bacterium]
MIYAVPGKNLHPLFVKELSILEQRYSGDLIVHILKIDAASHRSKQINRATINSNTFPVMKFSVFGNAEFVDYVSGVLGFLEVEAAMIHSKVI